MIAAVIAWTVAAIVLAVVAGLLLVTAAVHLRHRWVLSTREDEKHFATTGDGWRIALYRYRPAAPVKGREPVLLCHGLLSNRFSLDFDAEVSLAGFLRDSGFDVWLMELRGRGGSVREEAAPLLGGLSVSGRPKPSIQASSGSSGGIRQDARDSGKRGPPGRYGFTWTIDDFAHRDLPAAVDQVLAITGAPRLHWVGHSLGGMILYARAAVSPIDWCRSAVTIDSPGHFAEVRMITWPARLYARLIPVVPVIFFRPLAHLAYSLATDRFLWNLVRLDRVALLRILHNGLVDWGSSRVLYQLSACLAEGRFRSFDGTIDYETGPARIRFPLMVLRAPAGRNPEACVKHAFDTAGSDEKEYVKCGLAGGFSMEHNHFTLVIGREAPREVFPKIAAWLKKHSGA